MTTRTKRKTGRSTATPPAAEEPVNLDILPDLLVFNLRHLQGRLRRGIAERVRHNEKGAGLFSLMVLAGANPGIGQNRLARHCDLDEVSVVALLDRLEAAGWVLRQRSQEDRRRQGVFLTPAGTRKVRELKKIACEHEDRFLAPLDAGERKQLFALLRRLS
jgi:MarR family transcriptional regulator, lower aerobic nicotinate degradation pathway regulator